MKKKLTLAVSFAVAVMIVLAASLSHAQVDRTHKPAPGPLPKSAIPPYSEFTLKNGLRVVVVEDHKEPLVYFRTLVLSGNAQDGTMNGAAAAVSSLLEKGTKKMSADDIAKKLDFYGADIGAASGVDDINIFISSLKRDLGSVLPIYADVIKSPTFPADELEKYKSEQLSGLKAARQQPGDLGRRMGRMITYGMHPYGNFQTDSTVKLLTVDGLKAWHSKYFCGANMIMAVVGDITENDARTMLEKYFGDMPKGEHIAPSYPSLSQIKGMKISLIDRPGSKQSTVRLQQLGLPVTSPDFDKASLVMSIYAGNGVIGFQNRLFQNIREKHGYTYTPGGSLTRSIDPGVMVSIAEVRNSVTDSALEQMLFEYRRLSQEKISDEELNFAKGLIAGKFMMDLADKQNTASLILSTLEYGLPKDYYSTYPERISKFTPEELQEVAAKAFPPNDIGVIVVGDASQVLPKLQRFGKVTVYDLDLKPEKNAVEIPVNQTSATVDQVLAKLYAGINKPAYEKLTSRRIVGMVTMDAGGQTQKAKFEEIDAAPNKLYQKLDLGAPVVIEYRCDGSKIYFNAPGQSGEADPATSREVLRGATFNAELHLKDPGYTTKVLGTTLVPAGVAYILDVTRPGDYHEKWYVDTTTGYITRRENIEKEGVTTVDFSDFKLVDGIPYGFTAVQHGGGDQTQTITSIEHNITPDEKLFMKKQ